MSAAAVDGELCALREGVAWCQPDILSAVRVSGADHRAWLERVASNPVADLEAGTSRAATFLDGKGRMHAFVRLACVPGHDSLLLDVPTAAREALLRVLDLYVIGDDVRLADLSQEACFVSVLGPVAAELLQRLDLPCPGPGESASAAGVAAALPSHLSGTGGADLLVPAGAAAALAARLEAAGAVGVGPSSLDVVRLEQGIPRWEQDLAGGVLPPEAGLQQAASVTKGCYPGQEVVARLHNMGQVARRLVRLCAPGQAPLSPGAQLTGTGQAEGRPAGQVTSVAYDPSADTTRALGFVKRAFLGQGTELQAGAVSLVLQGEVSAPA